MALVFTALPVPVNRALEQVRAAASIGRSLMMVDFLSTACCGICKAPLRLST